MLVVLDAAAAKSEGAVVVVVVVVMVSLRTHVLLKVNTSIVVPLARTGDSMRVCVCCFIAIKSENSSMGSRSKK